MICTHNVIGEEKNYKLENYRTRVSIHDLYANMQFYFSYPLSETQSYYLLQDCLVALYYQLYFLECQTNWEYKYGYGWGYCKYGDQVKCEEGGNGVDGNGCTSWICKEGGKKEHEKDNKCGNDTSNPSPLQAFLTDCLKGFTCREVVKQESLLKKLRENGKDINVYEGAYPEFLSHRGHTSVFGTECAVPMGFSGSFRSGGPASGSTSGTAAAGQGNGMIGLGINAVLANYSVSNMETASLYQITRCICSLTRRVPRSTGTLFGFFYGLGLVCNGGSSKGGGPGLFLAALNKEIRRCPGWRKPSDLMEALMGWTETDHKTKHTAKTGGTGNFTLGSLHGCDYENKDLSCGDYLIPLTGSMYKCVSDRFCETYVSWIVHLTGVLKTGLESLLDEFVKIDCSQSGCSKKGGSGGGSGCQKGTHGKTEGTGSTGKGCCCESVVHCSGVHGLFYRFGFSYRWPPSLGGSGGLKRQCPQFYTQLEKVLNESPMNNLLEQLRKFIYSTRALFGVYIGVYWSIVIGYLLWSMTVNLDLMHIQSHWRSSSSHLLPVQRILADGSRNVKRVCTIGYFQDSGDRLLSQGISDVYL